jgi:hypothetical protein
MEGLPMAGADVAATRIGLVEVAARLGKSLSGARSLQGEKLAKGHKHEHAIAAPTSAGAPAAFLRLPLVVRS